MPAMMKNRRMRVEMNSVRPPCRKGVKVPVTGGGSMGPKIGFEANV